MKLSGVTSVLVAASDQHVHIQLQLVLKNIGVDNIVRADSTTEASMFLAREAFQLAIIDQTMHRHKGMNLIQEIRGSSSVQVAMMPLIVMVGTTTREAIALMMELDFLVVVQKPCGDTLIASKVFEALNSRDINSAHSFLDTVDYNQLTRVVLDAIRNKNQVQAEAIIQRRLRLDGKSPRLHNLFAQLRFAQGRLDEALVAVDRIIENNPDFLPALNMKAKICVRLGLFDEAVALLEKAQKISPLNTQRLLFLGELHLGRGRPLIAGEKFKRALDIYPELERAKIGLARSLAESGDKDEALGIINSLSDPMTVVSELNLKGVLLAKSRRFNEAVSLYRKAQTCTSKEDREIEAAISYNIALAHFKNRDLTSAEACAQLSSVLDPTFRKATSLLKRIHTRNFFTDEAIGEKGALPCVLSEEQIRFLCGEMSLPPQGSSDATDSKDKPAEPSRASSEIEEELL